MSVVEPRTWTLIIDANDMAYVEIAGSPDAPVNRVRVIELDPVLDLLADAADMLDFAYSDAMPLAERIEALLARPREAR